MLDNISDKIAISLHMFAQEYGFCHDWHWMKMNLSDNISPVEFVRWPH